MTRLPARFARVALLAAAFAVAVPALSLAQDAPADQQRAAQQGAAVQPSAELQSLVENFWHFGKIARYDLAGASAEQILNSGEPPAAVLQAFERTARNRNDNLDEWLLRWQGTEQLREPAANLISLLNEGRRTRRSDPAAIEANVRRLNTPRGYPLAIRELRDSGELAVPIMIDYLRNPAQAEFHAVIRNALRDLGRLGLNPLVAVTQSNDPQVVVPVASVLGEIGYGSAVPYLARLANGQNVQPAIRAAAGQALVRMGAGNPQALNVSELFYELGEKFYYDNADITADRRDPNAPANVWYWDDQRGLIRRQVPQVIFNEIMAMRASEYSLALGQARGDAQSLWLASNYKREAELPEGMDDPTRLENQPSAHFYGVHSGVQYLNNALARALRDRNWQVSLRVIKSLQEVVGRTNLFAGQVTGGAPALIDAMGAPDRLVRFESAFAIAAALPSQTFEGQERVVPLLAEAISQTGQPSAVVVMPSQDQANAAVDALRQAGYAAVGATSAEQAAAAANQLPAVDVLIIAEEAGPVVVDQTLATAQQSARLTGAAKLIVVRSGASPYAARAINDPLMTVTQAPDPEALKESADQARARASSLPIDQQAASSYALRAAELLHQLALTQIQTQNPVFNLAAAEQTLLAALGDQRPDVVKAAGHDLALLDSQPAQAALLQATLEQNASDDVRVSLLNALAISAKFFGNRLSAQQAGALDQLIVTTPNADVRNAAGEARGALNLPPDQARTLILQQARV